MFVCSLNTTGINELGSQKVVSNVNFLLLLVISSRISFVPLCIYPWYVCFTDIYVAHFVSELLSREYVLGGDATRLSSDCKRNDVLKGYILFFLTGGIEPKQRGVGLNTPIHHWVHRGHSHKFLTLKMFVFSCSISNI